MTQEDDQERFEEKALELQIELLHKSIDLTDNAVGRLDDIISKLRNWAIAIWTGSIALAINSDLPVLIPFTACIPLLFWVANAFYSKHLIACTYYQKQVADQFNSTGNVANIFRRKKFGSYRVFNPLSFTESDEPGYKREVNFKEAFKFKDSKILYPSLIVISFVVWIVVRS